MINQNGLVYHLFVALIMTNHHGQVYHLCEAIIITSHHGQVLPSLCEKTLVVYARSQSSVPTLCKPERSQSMKTKAKSQNKKSPSSPLICVWGSRWRHCWIHWPWWAGGTGESPSVQSRLDQIDNNAIIQRVPLRYLDIKAISCLAAAIT